jgi:D-apionolactonase
VREPSRFEILYGRDEPPVETRMLRAGPLTAELEGIDLRYVSVQGVEIVRRLFVAVRDASWGTIPPRMSGLEVEESDDGFRVSFAAVHEAAGLRFRWRGLFACAADGSVECRLDGLAETDFRYNRIGFCVLHPRENAGCRYRARTPDGEIFGELPDSIGPQRIEDGKAYPLFPSFDRLVLEANGVSTRFDFEGDLFEMEDQRNWTDASFKTYSTPITLGWPYDAEAGQSFSQAVRITVEGRPERSARSLSRPLKLELEEPSRILLPTVGLGMPSHGERLSDREEELIAALAPDHLRADLKLDGDTWRGELELAGSTAIGCAAGLELALFLGGDPGGELDALADALPLAQARIARFLVFKDGEVVTHPRWVALARERLWRVARDAAFVGGTDLWFTELNCERESVDGLDAVVYSINATVHADDDTSVGETPAAQGDTVRSARAISGDLPVVVSPVTIRPRVWPFGELEGVAGLPYQVDPRQCSLFGAAWTAASFKHLAEAATSSVTYFETTGWRGVVERENGSPQPGFPSRPGTAFPLYHVLADAVEWRYVAAVVPVRSDDPLAVEAFACRSDEGIHVLVANRSREVQRCAVGRLAVETVKLRVLDEESALAAGDDPAAFRSGREERKVGRGTLELELGPYAVVRIDP